MLNKTTRINKYIAIDSVTTLSVCATNNRKLIVSKCGKSRLLNVCSRGKKWAIFPPEIWDKKSYGKAYVVEEYCAICKKPTNDQGYCLDLTCNLCY